MSEVRPLWFGEAGRELFGLLHTPPSGSQRGGVVVCPAVGVEAAYTAVAARGLARRLAADGLLVLRIDYAGTGQSIGDVEDDDPLEGWPRSIVSAADVLRGCGAEWVAGVGVRLGALLLGKAAGAAGLDALVLWHPSCRGRTFLREQRALQAASAPPRVGLPDPEVPGLPLPAAAFQAIGGLLLAAEDIAGVPDVLAVADPAAPERTLLTALAADAGAELLDQESASIFDIEVVYEQSPAPIDQLADWLVPHAPRREYPVGPPDGTADVTFGSDGHRVRESVVRLGAHRLFGIESTPADRPAPTDAPPPTVLFLSMGAETSIGPSRQWVTLGRKLAAAGARCIRFDLSGIGESDARPGERERVLYTATALADIEDAVNAVRPARTDPTVLVGACSGAYGGLVVAPALQPTAVVAINPWLEIPAFTRPGGSIDERAGSRLPTRLRNLIPARWRHSSRWPRIRAWVWAAVPSFLWRIPVVLKWIHSPAGVLDAVTRSGVPALILCGAEEAYAPLRLSPRSVRRLNRSGSSRFEVVPHLQHSLLDARSRRDAHAHTIAFLSRHLEELTSSAPDPLPVLE